MLNDPIAKTGELAFQVVDEFSERRPGRGGTVFPVGQLPKQCWDKNGSHIEIEGRGTEDRRPEPKGLSDIQPFWPRSSVPSPPSCYFFAKMALLTFGGDIGSSVIRTPMAR